MSFFYVPSTPKMYALDAFKNMDGARGIGTTDWKVYKEGDHAWSVRHCDVILQVFETQEAAEAYKNSMSDY